MLTGTVELIHQGDEVRRFKTTEEGQVVRQSVGNVAA